MTALKTILTRCILDGDFLELLKTNPDAALLEFEITERQREILQGRDNRVLELLGEVHTEIANADSSSADPVELGEQDLSKADKHPEPDEIESMTVTTVDNLVPMKPTKLAVRLVPYASRVSEDPNSEIRLSYATHVNPLPESGSFDDLPPPPVQAEYGLALPTLAIHVSIQPYLTEVPDGQLVSFDVRTQVPDTVGEVHSGQESGAKQDSRKHLDNAVDAVRASAKEHRMDRLLDLISLINANDSELERQQ